MVEQTIPTKQRVLKAALSGRPRNACSLHNTEPSAASAAAVRKKRGPPPGPRGPIRKDLPHGWVVIPCVSSSGQKYTRYAGPNGEKVQSRLEAWRYHEQRHGPSVDPAATDATLPAAKAPTAPAAKAPTVPTAKVAAFSEAPSPTDVAEFSGDLDREWATILHAPDANSPRARTPKEFVPSQATLAASPLTAGAGSRLLPFIPVAHAM